MYRVRFGDPYIDVAKMVPRLSKNTCRVRYVFGAILNTLSLQSMMQAEIFLSSNLEFEEYSSSQNIVYCREYELQFTCNLATSLDNPK